MSLNTEARMVREYHRLMTLVNDMKTGNDLTPFRRELNGFSYEFGSKSPLVTDLEDKYKTKVIQLKKESDYTFLKLREKLRVEEARTYYSDSVETMQEINLQADMCYNEIMASLGTNDFNNKRFLQECMKSLDRPKAIALMKVMIMPEYSKYFREYQKEQIINASKSFVQKSIEHTQKENIDKINKELAEETRNNFLITSEFKRVNQATGYFED